MNADLSPATASVCFDAAGGWCFGWYHAPARPWRDMVVVMCPPVGYEAVSSYPTWAQLARSLAQAGFPVLRFDYQGTGDSEGDDSQPGRVAAWIASIEAAVTNARAWSGARQVALFGLRLGGTLAVEAAARLGGVDSLLLWAPCPTGKAFIRELRATGSEAAEGSLLALGYHYTGQTLHDLQSLDACKPSALPARRALVIGRDDLPGEGPLPKALRSRGLEVQYEVWPGYAAMVDEPRDGVLTQPTLEAVAAWFAASPAAAPRADPAPAAPRTANARHAGDVLETTLRLGPRGTLCGILAEPAARSAGLGDARPAVVLLNVGGNYRIGPHRFYVTAAREMAAAGYRVLRLDIAGIGDSEPEPGKPWANLYDKDSVRDVRAAIDALAARGAREFVLMGICSGSYVAFQTAMVDARVDGLVLMNSRLLEWTPGKAGDSWQNSMQQYAKSTDWYLRALRQPQVWRRVLRGEVNVRLIAGRFASLAAARIKRLFMPGEAAGGTLLSKMQRLCSRGTDVLMLVSDADDGRDYVEFHFGKAGRRLRSRANFRMAYVPEADHTFSRPGNQRHALDALLHHLARRARSRSTPQPQAHAPDLSAPPPARRASPTPTL